MGRISFLIVCCAILGTVANFAAAQTVHVVGDGMGWTVPPNTSAYANWASGKTFMVGDILEFNFMANMHDVVQVPLASYNDCSDDNNIGTIHYAAVNITLDSAGDRHYICSFGSHCDLGQKLSISVVSSGVAAPPMATPPPATPTTPSPATPQPEDCAPTPSVTPKAGGPTAGPGQMPPPPPPSVNAASVSQAASFLPVMMAAGVALLF